MVPNTSHAVAINSGVLNEVDWAGLSEDVLATNRAEFEPSLKQFDTDVGQFLGRSVEPVYF
jgi:hypothetical protein